MNYEVAYTYVAAILKAKPEGIVSISPEATVAQAAEMLAARRIGSIVVTDSAGALVGVISMRDVVNNRLPELEAENETIRAHVMGA